MIDSEAGAEHFHHDRSDDLNVHAAEGRGRKPVRRTRQLAPLHARTLPAREKAPPEVLDARFEQLAAVRDWILAAVGGCPDTRDMLLDLVSERLAMTDVAERGGQSVSAVSRGVQTALERIRWVTGLAVAADRHFDCPTDFTLDPQTGAPVGPVAEWAVSLAHLGVRLPRRPTPADLLLFLAQRADILRLRRGRPRYFGGWIESPGVFRLDVTVLLPDPEAAFAFADRHDQQAIKNMASGEELPVRHRDRRRAA